MFYAGSIARAGGNSERHLVDERIVGRKPRSLSFAEAAALPLTAITAWELLFERLQLVEGQGAGQQLLIVGAAGGVSSIMLQLARQLTKVSVIATASRPETQSWARNSAPIMSSTIASRCTPSCSAPVSPASAMSPA